jgi:hypothetical protein
MESRLSERYLSITIPTYILNASPRGLDEIFGPDLAPKATISRLAGQSYAPSRVTQTSPDVQLRLNRGAGGATYVERVRSGTRLQQ